MKRFGPLLLVILIASASLLAAAAYNTATVVNAGTIKVSNTTGALLALQPLTGVGNKDNTAFVNDGNLEFRFGRGNNPWFGGDQDYGLQKNSTYIWNQMFCIQNRSQETVVTEIQILDIPVGVKVYLMGQAGPPNVWQDMSDGLWHPILPLGWGSVGSGNTVNVGVKIEVGPGAQFTVTTPLKINVKATAQ